MTIQFVEIAGQKMAMMPIAEYEKLVDLAEERADIAAAADAALRREADEEYLPSAMVDRLLAGENALRVWRRHRGMTLDALAAKAGTGKSHLSEIENGKAQGRPALWRALAEALAVTADDILPER